MTTTHSATTSNGDHRVKLNVVEPSTNGENSIKPEEIFLKDYKEPDNWVTDVELEFDIREMCTTVTSFLTVKRNQNQPPGDLVLDGDETCVSLLELSVGSKVLQPKVDFLVSPGKLVIKHAALFENGDECPPILKAVVEIVPENNTALMGMYKSGSAYCSQCEAMGFRRITYFPDRPDNMSRFNRVRIEADQVLYPILLSNGNKLESGPATEQGRHYCVWSDPFPKPSYLFCIVAGNLKSINSTYTTMTGRSVHLEIFSEPENVGQLDHAMESLKKSMKWDEDTFGLEYDLDLYNIVAVNDFNMGAMENKGLNVFNTCYVLADPNTATDRDYEMIEGVIGHEYFHNWTGNRVTCRDWFQLTLKEGLTVFRDQSFSGDMGSRAVKRIEVVKSLRGRQFAEDAGPMAHPIRPESYISMDNFYTHTVYTKGAEVIGMYETLLSPQGFRKGMDLYFERHDGQAVTCDDFRAAMADANDFDLEQFALWYETPGTPVVSFEYTFADGTFTLTLTQTSKNELPLHIPVAMGLIDKVTNKEVVPTTVLNLRELKQSFTFDGLENEVVPSLLRNFSAPVKLVPISGKEDEEWFAFLAAHDTDGFNKWEAGQKLFTLAIMKLISGQDCSKTLEFVHEAVKNTLVADLDFSIKSYALNLPSESEIAEDMTVIDPVAVRSARNQLKVAVARKFSLQFQAAYDELTTKIEGQELGMDAAARGRRALRNTLLGYLCSIRESPEEQEAAASLATRHYKAATGLTDKMAALACLASMTGAAAQARDDIFQEFHVEAKKNALVLDKWFATQAVADLPDVLDRVKALKQHSDFTLKNPNRCRALIAAFTRNEAVFHSEDGAGYQFLGQVLAELDPINPQISSRLSNALLGGHRYNETRAALMRVELEKLANMKPISDDLYEKVIKGLNFKSE